MTFLSTKQTPPAARYASMVRDAFPGAAVDVVPAILGDGVRALVGHGAVVLTLEVSHAQGHRGPVPVTAVSARVPTRGAVLTLGPAASIPASAKAPRPPHPGLQSVGVLAAPACLAPALLDARALDALASLRGADHAPGDLSLDADLLSLRLHGWPGDPFELQRAAALVGELAARVPSALDGHFGLGATLHAHPEVRALRAWNAARSRAAWALVLGVVALSTLGAFALSTALVLMR